MGEVQIGAEFLGQRQRKFDCRKRRLGKSIGTRTLWICSLVCGALFADFPRAEKFFEAVAIFTSQLRTI